MEDSSVSVVLKNTLQHAKISIKSSVYRSVIILLMKKIIKTGTTYASNKCLFFGISQNALRSLVTQAVT